MTVNQDMPLRSAGLRGLTRPLLFAAIWLIAGLWIAHAIGISFWAAWVVGVAGLLAAQKHGRVGISIAVMALGACLMSRAQTPPPSDVSRVTGPAERSVALQGVVRDDPLAWWTRGGEAQVTSVIDVTALRGADDAWIQGSGRVRATFLGPHPAIAYGDHLLVEGILAAPVTTTMSRFRWAAYLETRGIRRVLRVRPHDPMLLHARSGWPFVRAAYGLRHHLRDVLRTVVPARVEPLLAALLLGERQGLPQAWRDAFVATGIAHLLAISGLNLALMALIGGTVLTWFGCPPRLRVLLLVGGLGVATLVAGGETPVLRAWIMATALLIGTCLERDSDLLERLGLAAILLLGWQPLQLFDAGFQLSFLAVASIAYLTPKFHTSVPPPPPLRRAWRHRLGRRIKEETAVSAAAYVGLVPVLVGTFGLITPLTLFMNLLMIPWFFVTLTGGLVVLAVGSLWPAAATLLAQPLAGWVEGFIAFVQWAAALPGATLAVPQFPWWGWGGYYLILVALVERERLRAWLGALHRQQPLRPVDVPHS